MGSGKARRLDGEGGSLTGGIKAETFAVRENGTYVFTFKKRGRTERGKGKSRGGEVRAAPGGRG